MGGGAISAERVGWLEEPNAKPEEALSLLEEWHVSVDEVVARFLGRPWACTVEQSEGKVDRIIFQEPKGGQDMFSQTCPPWHYLGRRLEFTRDGGIVLAKMGFTSGWWVRGFEIVGKKPSLAEPCPSEPLIIVRGLRKISDASEGPDRTLLLEGLVEDNLGETRSTVRMGRFHPEFEETRFFRASRQAYQF